MGRMIRSRLAAARRAVRTLTGWTLRRSGSLPPLSRRGWWFDAGLAAVLTLLAILTADGDQPDVRAPVPLGPDGYPELPLPVPPIRPPAPSAVPAVPAAPPVELHDTTTAPEWFAQALLLVLIAAPLVLRRRYPLSVLWVVLVTAAFVGDDQRSPLQLSFVVGLIAAYSAAVHSPYRVPALASLLPAAFLYQQLQGDAAEPALGGAFRAVPDGAVPYLILLPIAVAAYGLRDWRARADAERERVSVMERERAEAVRLATEEERARIARELHDVVTHNVSVMVIQAGAARKVLDAAPELAREALLAVEASGRAAMTELRHVMGLLTMEGGAVELAPQPGLGELEALVGRVRDAGTPVELVVTGRRGPAVPDGVDLAAYRVVQEALTNAVKHAAGAPAAVRLEYRPDRLRIEVTDGGGAAGPGDPGSGRGLIGLRERLAVYGGTLHAERRIRGGYRVEAVIPLHPAPADTAGPDAAADAPAEAR